MKQALLPEKFCLRRVSPLKDKPTLLIYTISHRYRKSGVFSDTRPEYGEIAALMFISIKTVDNLFNSVAKKVGSSQQA